MFNLFRWIRVFFAYNCQRINQISKAKEKTLATVTNLGNHDSSTHIQVTPSTTGTTCSNFRTTRPH